MEPAIVLSDRDLEAVYQAVMLNNALKVTREDFPAMLVRLQQHGIVRLSLTEDVIWIRFPKYEESAAIRVERPKPQE